MIVKLLTDKYLEILSLKGGCRGSSESPHVKMPHWRKFHALAHIFSNFPTRNTFVISSFTYASCLFMPSWQFFAA